MDQHAFLSRVAEAVRAGQRYRVHVPPVEPPPVAQQDRGALISQFVDELTQVGGTAACLKDAEELKQTLLGWFEQHEVKELLCWQDPLLEQLKLPDFLAREGFRVWTPQRLRSLAPQQRQQVCFQAQGGLAAAELAIAESGTVVLPSGPERPRQVSLLPPVVVVIVPAQKLVADLFDVFRSWGASAPGSYTALVTGPSKTGDIQLQLTTGVHGPGKWYVLVWDEQP